MRSRARAFFFFLFVTVIFPAIDANGFPGDDLPLLEIPPRQLYHPGEFHDGGGELVELQRIKEDYDTVTRLQRRLRTSETHFPQLFHQKTHAVVLVIFRLLSNLPPEVKYGIFSGTDSDVWLGMVRFSTFLPRVHGLTLELIPLNHPLDADHPIRPLNFLMTDQIIGDTHRDFIEFAKASAHGVTGFVAFWKKHPQLANRLFRSIAAPVPSLFTQTYSSGHPYLLGEDEKGPIAFKFNMSLSPEFVSLPEAGARKVLFSDFGDYRRGGLFSSLRTLCKALVGGCNYLSKDTYEWLARGAVQMRFRVMRENREHSERTPIEKNSVAWEEPLVDAATVTFLPQAMSRLLIQLGGRFNFNPAESAFIPLSNMGWGRAVSSYIASSRGGSARSRENDRVRQDGYRRIIEAFRTMHPTCQDVIPNWSPN